MITQQQYQQLVQTSLNHCFSMMTDPEKLYFIHGSSLGDIIVLGGYTRALLNKTHKKSAVMIVQQRYEPVNIDFDGLSDIKYLNHVEFSFLSDWFHATKQYYGPNFMFTGAPKGYVRPPELKGLEIVRQIWDLPPDASFNPPIVRDIPQQSKDRFSRQYILDKKRTIILAPRANTPMSPPSLNFWQNLAANLSQRGYIVYTNIGKNAAGVVDSPLPGTPPLDADIHEIFYLADKVKCFIGVRSGLFDLLAFSKGNLICLTPSEWTHADLKEKFLNTPSKIHTLYFNWEFFPKLNEVLAQFGVESMVVTSFKHKVIPNDQIFFDEQGLLSAVLRAVEAQ